jgi:uncharacterized protein
MKQKEPPRPQQPHINSSGHAEDVLEGRPLHQIMILINRTERWGQLRIASCQILAGLLLAGCWYALTGDLKSAGLAGLLLLAFGIADEQLIRSLPRRKISFGPVAPQSIILLLSRLAASLFPMCLGLFTSPVIFLLSLALLNLAGSAILYYALCIEPFHLGVSRIEWQSPYWPADAPPIRLLHLSDLHIERLTQREETLLTEIQRLKPDIIVITGDYLNLSFVEDKTAQEHCVIFLNRLAAPSGIFATLGSPPVDVRRVIPALFERLSVQLLSDQTCEVDFGLGRKLSMIGLDCSHDPEYDFRRLENLLDGKPKEAPQVLLYHSPELGLALDGKGIDLYLCGHTHGGQVRLPWIGALVTSSQLGKRFEMGRYNVNGTLLYVSRGIGMEGLCMPRLRFLSPPEITLFEISGKKD